MNCALRNPPRVLIVDDDADCCWVLAGIARKEGCEVCVAHEGETALELVVREKPDLMLVDRRMPGVDGLEVLRRTRELAPSLPVIMLTAYCEEFCKRDALDMGARGYFSKPFDNEELAQALRRALGAKRAREEAEDPAGLRELMGPSEAVTRLISQVACVAGSDLSVVITGETGSGKELVARAVHRASLRENGPFVPVDCGAIPDTLFESEMFGYEKGAFTGAVGSRKGKMALAHEGTLLLDEICNLSLFSQAKLLRVIQDRKVFPLGGSSAADVDVRILVSSNQDPLDEAKAGHFRKDLFFRLNEFSIRVPALRERREDIPFLAERFLKEMRGRKGKCAVGFSGEAIDEMLACQWPGNVRQLRSVVRRAAILTGQVIRPEHLNLSAAGGGEAGAAGAGRAKTAPIRWKGQPLREIVEENVCRVEREVIRQALESSGGNKAEAARRLRVDYKTLHNKLKKLGI